MGICFKESLTAATIAGGKVETRRKINLPGFGLAPGRKKAMGERIFQFMKGDQLVKIDEQDLIRKVARYKKGSYVYLKEPSYEDPRMGGERVYKYDLSITDERRGQKIWDNKLFMKKDLARHWIFITGVHIEKLQQITRDGVIREGVTHYRNGQTKWGNYQLTRKVRKMAREGDVKAQMCVEKVAPYDFLTGKGACFKAFASLIDMINGRGTWDSDPWVFVYSYRYTIFDPRFSVLDAVNFHQTNKV